MKCVKFFLVMYLTTYCLLFFAAQKSFNDIDHAHNILAAAVEKDPKLKAACFRVMKQYATRKRWPLLNAAVECVKESYSPEVRKLIDAGNQDEFEDSFQQAEDCLSRSDFSGAVHAYQEQFEKGYQDDAALVGFGKAQLALGKYVAGFNNLQARLNGPKYSLKKPFLKPCQILNVSKKKRILLRREGDIGDMVFFTMRYVKFLKQLTGATIVCEAHYPEKSILGEFVKNNPNVVSEIVNPDSLKDDQYDHDMYCKSLPYYLGVDFKLIPTGRYLTGDSHKVQSWIDYFAQNKGFHVPFSWRTNKKDDDGKRLSAYDIPLNLVAKLSRINGVCLHPLGGTAHRPITQKEYDLRKKAGRLKDGTLALDELDIVPDDCTLFPLKDFDQEGPFSDTIAFLRALAEQPNKGMLISVDAPSAYIGGATGAPTIVLLPQYAEPIWGNNDTERSDWFDSLTLLRQKKQGDWKPVFQDLSTKINEWLALKSGKLPKHSDEEKKERDL